MVQRQFSGQPEDFPAGLRVEQIALFVRRHALVLLGAAAIGAASGYVGTRLVPSEWQARTVLQIGQVTRTLVGPNGASTATMPIELPPRSVERLQLPQFENQVLRNLGLPLSRFESDATALLRDSTLVTLLRAADLVSVSVRGYSPETARRYAQAYQERLIEEHAALLKPSLDRAKAEIDQAQAALSTLQARRVQLNSASDKRSNPDGKFAEHVLLNQLQRANDDEIHAVEFRVQALQEDLNPLRTFNSRPMAATIDVSERPVFPKPSVFVGLGILIGLVVGASIGLVADWRRRGIAPQ